MADISDPWDHHDWASHDYVLEWAERQDDSEPHRDQAFGVIAATMPCESEARVKILDIGSGYGALTYYLLSQFPHAQTVCHDGSAEMLALGRERLAKFKDRVKFIQSDLSEPGWSKKLAGPFDAVVSSIAIHNVREHATIRSIYRECFDLLNPGGCFLNLDRMRPSVNEQLDWLREAGYQQVQQFWDGGKRAIVGGFRQSD